MPGDFEINVKACAALNQHYRAGIQALSSSDRQHLHVPRPRQLTGSLNLDEALAGPLPNDPRWDYGIGYRPGKNGAETVHWIEVHPATDGEVKVVEAKLFWLTRWLGQNALNLHAMPRRYVWVSSGKTTLTQTAPARKRLALKGLIIAGSTYRIG